MLRGNFSNEPAPTVAVDWKVLARVTKKYAGLWTNVDLVPGARGWLDRNWEYRFFAVIVGSNKYASQIESTLLTVVPEVKYSQSAADLRVWLQRNPQVICFYTNDKSLLSLDHVTRPFSGWHDGVVDGLRSSFDLENHYRRKVKRGDGPQSTR